jgi:hypothetical protein
MSVVRTSISLLFVAIVVAGAAIASPPQRPSGSDVRPSAPDSLSSTDLLGGTGIGSAALESHTSGPASFPFELRSIDGAGNNRGNPDWGRAGVPLLRRTAVDYEDGAGSPGGQHRVSAREISNLCVAQPAPRPNAAGASDFLWQWGQFLDHDLDLVPIADPAEPFDVAVPLGDAWFDPAGTGTATIPLERSHYEVVDGIRQQVNAITAFIDASNVYGSDPERALALRTLDGTGRLKTSPGALLPFNVDGLPNAPSSAPSFFVAGDVRANEQVGLTAMHALFVREHNLWANIFRFLDPRLDDDDIYELARAIVAAEMQAITYREFLPVLLGPKAVSPYRGYKPGVNAGVTNVFATAAYRVGHTMLSSRLLRLRANGEPIAAGHLSLADAFFRPDVFVASGLEPLLRGLAAQPAQEIDPQIIDEVRNFLFGPPGSGGFDLATLNIQRGRDHGLPGYNEVREAFGLTPAATFADINPDADIQAALAAAYATPDDVDVWVGGLSEPHRSGAVVGETFFEILKDQFERARDGDRFWYQSYLPQAFVFLVEESTLSRIIRRNTRIGRELQADVFRVPK